VPAAADSWQENTLEILNELPSGLAMNARRLCIIGLLLTLVVFEAPAVRAVTGEASPAGGWAARPIVMVLDGQGDLCTGTALAADLVLTAAHCVQRPARYMIKVYQTGHIVPVQTVARHPGFNPVAYAASRATADLALLKLSAPIFDLVNTATLAPSRRVRAGETLTIAGFGVTAAGTSRGLGIPRMAKLVVTGSPGSLQIRLFDPLANNQRAGLGACTGDSGGPAFEGERASLVAVVSWTTAPKDEEGCGGLTGLTPILTYRTWIIETAKQMKSSVKMD
jgi:hypothetical protein